MNLANVNDVAELLPIEAEERLRGLRRARADNSGIMRSIVESVLETRAVRQDAEQRLRSLTQTSRPLPPDHPSVQQAQRAIDKASAELLRLANHEATTAATFNHASHLVTAIERWARDHVSAGRTFALAPTIEARLLKGENVVDAIERNRREVRRLEADLHACRSAPIPSAEAKVAMRSQVAALAERGRPYVEGLIEHRGEEIKFAEEQMQTIARGETVAHVGWTQFDALGLVAWLHQKALTDKLAAEIDAAAADDAALSTADRRKRETELLTDIAMTQKQIAALIRAAEAENIEVTFEVDTPPEIVLGVVVVDAPQSAGTDLSAEILRQQRAVQAASGDPQAVTKALIAGMRGS